MMTMSRTLCEALILIGLASGAGLAVNAARQDRIDIDRDYFPPRTGRPDTIVSGEPRPTPPRSGDSEVERPADGPPDHDFKTMDAETVLSYVELGDSSVLVIDARDDEHYSHGHIQGAMQFDYYMADRYIGPVLQAAAYAQTIIIYCGGGECEDSISAANYLTSEINPPLPFEHVYVYEGGIKEWCSLELPVEGECK
jgi:rhodanese-related sulfurtransferase